MNYAAVINGCTDGYLQRAREIHTFTERCLSPFSGGTALVVYTEEGAKDELVSTLPYPEVLTLRIPRYRPGIILKAIERCSREMPADVWVFDSGYAGGELTARFAHRAGGAALTGVRDLRLEDGGTLVCTKAVYGGYLLGEFEVTGRPACLSLAKGSPAEAAFRGPEAGHVREIETPVLEHEFVESTRLIPGETRNELESAGFILAAGGGVSTRGDLERVAEAADALGAEFGASRPVTMNGWVPMNRQLGASGIIGKPKIALALAVSGSAAFMAGIEKSGFVAAVNTDPKAPIFRQADAAVIDDYRPVLEELVRLAGAEEG